MRVGDFYVIWNELIVNILFNFLIFCLELLTILFHLNTVSIKYYGWSTNVHVSLFLITRKLHKL